MRASWLERSVALQCLVAAAAGQALAGRGVGAGEIGLCALLSAAGLALGGVWGRGLAVLAASAVVGVAWPAEPPAEDERTLRQWEGGPVTVHAVRSGDWRRIDHGWRAPIAVRSVRRGHRVVPTGGWRIPLSIGDDAEGAAPPAGRTLVVRGLLVERLPLHNGVVRPSVWGLTAKAPARMVRSSGAETATTALRRWLDGRLPGWRKGGSRGQQLAGALWLADPDRLDPALLSGIRRWGLSHLLAVSGLHVGLLVGALVFGSRLLPGAVGSLSSVLALAAIVVVIGPRVSVLRAVCMMGLALLALAQRRFVAPEERLAIAGLAVLVAVPGALEQIGAWLSFLATAVLIATMARRAPAPRGLLRGVSTVLVASVAVQAVTLPLAARLLPLTTPATPVLNLLFVPGTGLVLAASLAHCVLAALGPELAPHLLDLSAAPFSLLEQHGPWAWWQAPTTAPSALGLALLLAAAATARLCDRGSLRLLPLFLLVGLDCAGTARPLVLTFIDVGQGDAVLVADGAAAVLVDGGGWSRPGVAESALLPVLAAEGIGRLQAVVSSHGDRDHCGGLLELARYVAVGELWAGAPSGPCSSDLEEVFDGRRRRLRRGDRLTAGRWRIEVLADGRRARSANDASIVLRAEAGPLSVVLTGDLGRVGELRLVERLSAAGRGDLLRAGLLKAGHHGSRSSSHPRLVAAVRPAFSVVSVGRGNRYGHPSPEVLDALRGGGGRVLRTDLDGRIRFAATPVRLGLETARARRLGEGDPW